MHQHRHPSSEMSECRIGNPCCGSNCCSCSCCPNCSNSCLDAAAKSRLIARNRYKSRRRDCYDNHNNNHNEMEASSSCFNERDNDPDSNCKQNNNNQPQLSRPLSDRADDESMSTDRHRETTRRKTTRRVKSRLEPAHLFLLLIILGLELYASDRPTSITQQNYYSQLTRPSCLKETTLIRNWFNLPGIFKFAEALEMDSSSSSQTNGTIGSSNGTVALNMSNVTSSSPLSNDTDTLSNGNKINAVIGTDAATTTPTTTTPTPLINSTGSTGKLVPATPVNIVCNSRCKCIKVSLVSRLDELRAPSKTNDSNAILTRFFNDANSVFAYESEDDNVEPSNATHQSINLAQSNSQPRHLNWSDHLPYMDQLEMTQQQQHQQQLSPSMVFPLPTNYHHGGSAAGQAGHHQHLHHRMMLYPHLARQHQRADAVSAAQQQQQTSPSTNYKQQQIRANNSSVAPNRYASYESTRNNSNMVERFVPLRELNLTSQLNDPNSTLSSNYNVETFELGNFTVELKEKITQLMLDIERNEIESLSLRHNSLEFELWGEIYALLVVRARRNLYCLDLSHNKLAKLGVTFTGYIEHHLIASRGEWPFVQSNNQSSPSLKFINLNNNLAVMSQPLGAGGPMNLQSTNLITKQQQHHSPTSGNKPYMLISGGKLFSLVQQRLNGTAKAQNLTTGNVMQIRALDLSHNALKWLINDQFRALKNVQTIRLDHNRIRFIHQHAFTGLESLRFLNLAYNKLQVIYIEQFQSNYNLQALSLRANTIAYLRAGSFASLGNLKELDLSQNKLTTLSNSAFIGLESVERLNMSSNQFVHAPSGSLHPLTALRKLDLSNNLIAQLAPGTFFHLPIEELWLNQNEQLVNIDRGSFWDMPYLNRLHLFSCPMLMTINPQAFVGIQNLNYINANDCQSLDSESKQLLQNITAMASRQMRQEVKVHNGTNNDFSPAHMKSGNNSAKEFIKDVPINLPKHQLTSTTSLVAAAAGQDDLGHVIDLANNRLKYAYYATSLLFLIVALKLILKYSQVNSSMRSRRRRVYESGTNDGHLGNNLGCVDDETLSVYESYELQDQNNPTIKSNRRRSEDCSSSSVISINEQEGDVNVNNAVDSMEEIPLNDDQDDKNPEGITIENDVDDNQQLEINIVGDGDMGAELGEGGLNDDQRVAIEPNQVDSINLAECGAAESSCMVQQCVCPNCSEISFTQEQSQQVPDDNSINPTGPQINHEYTTCNQCNMTQANSIQLQDMQQCDTTITGNSTNVQPDESRFNQLLQFEFDHANCNHFYPSIGSAIQFADLVNSQHFNDDEYF